MTGKDLGQGLFRLWVWCQLQDCLCDKLVFSSLLSYVGKEHTSTPVFWKVWPSRSGLQVKGKHWRKSPCCLGKKVQKVLVLRVPFSVWSAQHVRELYSGELFSQPYQWLSKGIRWLPHRLGHWQFMILVHLTSHRGLSSHAVRWDVKGPACS